MTMSMAAMLVDASVALSVLTKLALFTANLGRRFEDAITALESEAKCYLSLLRL